MNDLLPYGITGERVSPPTICFDAEYWYSYPCSFIKKQFGFQPTNPPRSKEEAFFIGPLTLIEWSNDDE